jgi:hypothetical protein
MIILSQNLGRLTASGSILASLERPANSVHVENPHLPLYQILFVGIAVLLVTGRFLGAPGDIVD